VLAWGEEAVIGENGYAVKIEGLDGPLRGRILVDRVAETPAVVGMVVVMVGQHTWLGVVCDEQQAIMGVVTHMRDDKRGERLSLRQVKCLRAGVRNLYITQRKYYIPESGSEELLSQGEQVHYLYKRSVVCAQSKSGQWVWIGKHNNSE
jgi:hypothetical protein